MKLTRFEATRIVETAARVWIWGRGYRIIGHEIGYGNYATRHAALNDDDPIVDTILHPAVDACWRADLVAVTKLAAPAAAARRGLPPTVALIEVKGTRADARRESYASGKWRARIAGADHILIVNDESVPLVTAAPEHWSILSVDLESLETRVVRKAERAPGVPDVARAQRLCAMALTAASLGGVPMGGVYPASTTVRKLLARQSDPPS